MKETPFQSVVWQWPGVEKRGMRYSFIFFRAQRRSAWTEITLAAGNAIHERFLLLRSAKEGVSSFIFGRNKRGHGRRGKVVLRHDKRKSIMSLLFCPSVIVFLPFCLY